MRSQTTWKCRQKRIFQVFASRQRQLFFVVAALSLTLWHASLRAEENESPWEVFIRLTLQANTPDAMAEAEALYQQISQAGTSLDPDNTRLVWSLTRLAGFHRRQNHLPQAEKYQVQVLQLLEKQFGLSDLLLVEPLNELAITQFAQGRISLSRQTLERALTIVEEMANPNHLLTVGILKQLATIHLAQHNPQKAEQLQQRIAEVQEQALMMETPGDAIILARQARRQLQEGNKELASSLFQQSKDILMESSGPYHSARVEVLSSLAQLSYDDGDYAQSVELLRSALAISENMRGTNHPDLVPVLIKLATGYQKMGKPNQSRPVLTRTLSLVENLYGKDHEKTAEILLAMGDNLRLENQLEPAVDYYNRGMVIFRRQNSDSGLMRTLLGLSRTQQMQGKTGSAVRNHQEALEIIAKTVGDQDPEYRTAYKEQAELVAELEEQQRAARDNFANFIQKLEFLRIKLLSLGDMEIKPMAAVAVPFLP